VVSSRLSYPLRTNNFLPFLGFIFWFINVHSKTWKEQKMSNVICTFSFQRGTTLGIGVFGNFKKN
jgi:hypothetical protein